MYTASSFGREEPGFCLLVYAYLEGFLLIESCSALYCEGEGRGLSQHQPTRIGYQTRQPLISVV